MKKMNDTYKVNDEYEEEEEEGEWEWEEEEEEEEEVKCNGILNENPVDKDGKANIKVDGNMVTIERMKPVDLSDEEFDDDDGATTAPPPPPPPPAPPAPPAPPPPSQGCGQSIKNSERVERLKKRPTKRPDWNDLMMEIGHYKSSCHGLLKKTMTNDRSEPILSGSKVKGLFVYESEKDSENADILTEISQGAKLKRVRCNDRSKPNLKGIKSFKRQLTKEEKTKSAINFDDESLAEMDENENVEKVKDDLESTKQLLELEVRSKQLLEKDNKRLQAEIEKLKVEFEKMQKGEEQGANLDILNSILSVRKESIKEKRKSIVRADSIPFEPQETESSELVSEEVIGEMEELKEEVDEARKLAEEWEAKYKEMQRQMDDIDPTEGIRPSYNRAASNEGLLDETPVNRRTSVVEASDGDDWMMKREVNQLQGKLKNTKDKKEIIVRERNLLTERIDSLKKSIAVEFGARKILRKEIKDMNAVFKEEMADVELMEQTEKDLEDCYYGDDSELVTNTCRKTTDDDEEMDEYADYFDDDDMEDSVDEILNDAEAGEESDIDSGASLFEQFKTDTSAQSEIPNLPDFTHDKQMELLNNKIDEEFEKVNLMRKSNFSLKSKIDILYDILQTQKEKHYDLKQELNRMLADIQ